VATAAAAFLRIPATFAAHHTRLGVAVPRTFVTAYVLRIAVAMPPHRALLPAVASSLPLPGTLLPLLLSGSVPDRAERVHAFWTIWFLVFTVLTLPRAGARSRYHLFGCCGLFCTTLTTVVTGPASTIAVGCVSVCIPVVLGTANVGYGFVPAAGNTARRCAVLLCLLVSVTVCRDCNATTTWTGCHYFVRLHLQLTPCPRGACLRLPDFASLLPLNMFRQRCGQKRCSVPTLGVLWDYVTGGFADLPLFLPFVELSRL